MTNIIKKEEIIKLLEIQEVYKYNLNSIKCDGYVTRYKNNNPFNHYIHDEEYTSIIKDENLYKSRKTKEEKAELFANFFSNANTPIKYYDDAFWTLFTYNELSHTTECNWDQKYYNYVSKDVRTKQVNFLKTLPQEGLFESFTDFLNRYGNTSGRLIEYWVELAKKKSNKAFLKEKSIYKFLLDFNEIDKKTLKYIKKVELLSYFKSDEAIEQITKIHNLAFNNASLLKHTTEALNRLGCPIEVKSLKFVDDFEEEVLYIQKKYINPEALIQNNIMNKNQINDFLELFEYFITTALAKKGIKTDCTWIFRWDNEIKEEKKVYEIKTEMKYDWQREETKKWLEEVIEITLNQFLIGEFKEDMNNYNSKDIMSKELFYEFFKQFIEKAVLKDKIETRLGEKNEESSIKKNKI